MERTGEICLETAKQRFFCFLLSLTFENTSRESYANSSLLDDTLEALKPRTFPVIHQVSHKAINFSELLQKTQEKQVQASNTKVTFW